MSTKFRAAIFHGVILEKRVDLWLQTSNVKTLKLIDNGNYPVRMFLESWQTMLTRIGDNINSSLSLRQYSILFSKKFLNIFFLNFLSIWLIKFLFYCIMLELFSVLNHFVRLRPQSNRSKARIS